MERLRPETPTPRSHSAESIREQEALGDAGDHGAFVYFRRYFVVDGVLERTKDGTFRSEFTIISLDGDQIDLGHHPECEIVIDWDPAVARAHTQLKKAGADWYIDNLDRTNGTSVNGVQVDLAEEYFLTDGDRIRVGDTVLVFRQPGLGRAEPPERPWQSEEAPPQLTERKKEVLIALVRPTGGVDLNVTPASNAEIAKEVVIDEETVKGHIRDLYKAFGLSDEPDSEKRRKLVWRALELGVVTDLDLSQR